MSPETLLVAKLSWLLLLCGGFLGHAGGPHVPLLPWFDALRAVPGIAAVAPALFLLGGLALLTNQFTRHAAVVAGICVLVTPIQSIAAWRSHEWIAGSLLLLAGLQTPGQRPWMLRVQVTLCMVAMLLDRPAAVDWWPGVALEGWRADDGVQPVLDLMRGFLSPLVLRVITGWCAPIFALAVAVSIWVPAIRNHALWTACAFHLGGYVLLASKDAALHTLALLIGTIAFLDWPRESIAAHWPRACGWPMWLRIVLGRYDFDRRIEWPFPENPDADLDVWVDGRHCFHRKGISALLLFFPPFHFVIFAFVMALHFALPVPWSMVAHACVGGWLLVFFALPTFVRVSRRWRR